MAGPEHDDGTTDMTDARGKGRMKRSKTTALLLMGTAPLLFTACQRTAPVEVQEGLYTSVESCVQAVGDTATCRIAFEQAKLQAADSAPQYSSREACEAEFPAEECVEQKTSTGHSFVGPLMAGFFLSQMMNNNRAGAAAAQRQPQAAPAFRDNRAGWLRPNGAPGAGRAGMAPVSATPDRAMTASRGGFGRSASGRSTGG